MRFLNFRWQPAANPMRVFRLLLEVINAHTTTYTDIGCTRWWSDHCGGRTRRYPSRRPEPAQCCWRVRGFGDRNGIRLSGCPDDVGQSDGDEDGRHGDCHSPRGDARDIVRLTHLQSASTGRMCEQRAMPVTAAG